MHLADTVDSVRHEETQGVKLDHFFWVLLDYRDLGDTIRIEAFLAPNQVENVLVYAVYEVQVPRKKLL